MISLGQIVKKSCYPRWNETFEFELEEGAAEVLCVEAWDWDLVSRNDFLGKVSALPLQATPAGLHSGHPIPQRVTQEARDPPGAQGPSAGTPSQKNSGWQGRETRIPASGRPHLSPANNQGLSCSQVVVNVQRLWAAQREEGWFRLQPDQSKSRREE